MEPGTALAVLWLDASAAEEGVITEALDALAVRQDTAAFFLSAQGEYTPDLLRRIYAQGHAVGFVSDSIDDLDAANERLFAAARTVTRCTFYNGQEDIAAAGYINCPWTINASDYSYASAIANRLEGDMQEIVRFELSESGLRLMGSLLAHLTGRNGAQLEFNSLRETLFS